jgi:hypothetical protein
MAETTAQVAADALAYDQLPDFETFDAAAWAVQDTLDRVSEGAA